MNGFNFTAAVRPLKIINVAVFSIIILFFGHGVYGTTNPENGVRREYFPNGKIHSEAFFKKGHLVRSRVFYENGRLMSDFRFKPVYIVSKRTFYDNGMLRSEWSIKTGIIKFYSRQGVLTH